MKIMGEKANIEEKNRVREEIERQVQQFLSKGGRIEVVSAGLNGRRAAIGSVWHGQDDFSDLGQRRGNDSVVTG